MQVSCKICFEDVNESDIINHSIKCFDDQIQLINSISIQNGNEIQDRTKEREKFIRSLKKKYMKHDLTDKQEHAIRYVRKKSKVYHKNTIANSEIRFIDLGYSESDLYKCINYIQNNVDVIIHFDLDKLAKPFTLDIKYRNLFEVNSSGGTNSFSMREDWEDNLFNSIYKDAQYSERVKYGCLNMLCERTGCGTAHHYGKSYMILKNYVKKRVSFVNGDSSLKQIHIACFDNFGHLFLHLDTKLIHNIMSIIMGKKDSEIKIYPYIEVQIHGDIDFGKDIHKLMIDKNNFNMTNKSALDYFVNKYDIQCEFI